MNHNYKSKWLCKCDCGKEMIVGAAELKNGQKSCGCDRKKIYPHFYKKVNSAWRDMIIRCCNKQNKYYHCYGGRGIKVCDGWLNSFENFYKDVKEPDNKNLTLDRINNNLHYSCGKCEECLKNNWKFNIRWATIKIQSRNTRRNKIIEYNNEKKCIAEWSEVLNLNENFLRARLRKGFSIKEILENPTQRKFKTSKYRGVHFSKIRGKWVAQIEKENNKIFLGAFCNESEAALTYNNAAIQLYGDKANLNII